MSLLLTGLRRSIWLVLIGAVGGTGVAWWRDRNAPPSPSSPPEWPPLDPGQRSATASTPKTQTADPAPTTPVSSAASAPSTDTGSTTSTSSSGSASIVNALVDAPEARSAAGSTDWVEPLPDGSCPPTHPIKANDNSGIFHVPGGRFYDRTNPERCYSTADAAIADGYRQAKA